MPVTPLYLMAYPLTWKAMPSQPRWLAEGLARYVQTAQLADGDSVTLGAPQRAAQQALRRHGRLLSIGQLWNWRVHAPEHAGASAWLWVHHLMSAQPQRFADFRTRLNREEEAYAAFHAAFAGVDWAQELERLAASVLKGDYPTFRLPVPQQPPLHPEVRLLEDGEVHLMHVELGAWGPRDAEARRQYGARELARAQAHDPAGFSTRLLTLGTLPPEQQLEAARQLTRDFPGRAEAWQRLARQLSAAKAPAAQQAEAHGRALALAPHNPTVLNNGAWYFVNAGEVARAEAPAREALRLAPYSAYVVDTAALVAAKQGRCEEARELQRRALTRVSRGDSAAQAMIERLESFEKDCAAPAQPSPPPGT